MSHYYTVYNNKTDEVVAFGSAKECADKLRLKNVRLFYSYVSKSKSGLIKKYKIVVENNKEDK